MKKILYKFTLVLILPIKLWINQAHSEFINDFTLDSSVSFLDNLEVKEDIIHVLQINRYFAPIINNVSSSLHFLREEWPGIPNNCPFLNPWSQSVISNERIRLYRNLREVGKIVRNHAVAEYSCLCKLSLLPWPSGSLRLAIFDGGMPDHCHWAC